MSAAPVVRGPRDLPDLRTWLRDQWRPGGPFAYTAQAAVGVLQSRARAVEAGDQIAAWCERTLARAALWFVGAEMVDLIETSAASLPPVTFVDQLLPVSTGLVVFERPMQGIDAQGGPRVLGTSYRYPLIDGSVDDEADGLLVDAVAWSQTRLAARDFDGPIRPGVSFMMYRRIGLAGGEAALFERNPDGTRGSTQLGPSLGGNDAWLPLGRTDWAVGDDWSTTLHGDMSETVQRSMAEDRRWMATLWALAVQPNLVDVSDQWPGKPAAKRAARAGYSDPKVRVVNLRRTVYEDAGASREPIGSSGRRYRVRWPVEGHWRNQAYGPGRLYRRPTWIAPYMKGPEGAPLRTGATVHVLREQP